MIKPKTSVSHLRNNKKSLRPHSSGASLPRKPLPSLITKILFSLEQNVKELKTYYHSREAVRGEKSVKGFRVKRTLLRNSSQSNLNPGDKSEQDIFEIRNEYLRVHGRLSNNISELYEFYRKNQEKREKSTRILASMEFSYGGQSVSGYPYSHAVAKSPFSNIHSCSTIARTADAILRASASTKPAKIRILTLPPLPSLPSNLGRARRRASWRIHSSARDATIS